MSSQDAEIPHGHVTAVYRQRKNHERLTIHIDDEFAFGLHAEVAARFGIRRDTLLTEDVAASALQADELVRARQAAFSVLSRGPISIRRFRDKLARKGFSPGILSEVVDDFRNRGLLDDSAFARTYATSRLNAKGHGRHRIRTDLLKQGLERQVVDQTLADIEERTDWLTAARTLAEKRWPRLKSIEDVSHRRKRLYDYLVRRGYDYDIVRRVVDELTES